MSEQKTPKKHPAPRLNMQKLKQLSEGLEGRIIGLEAKVAALEVSQQQLMNVDISPLGLFKSLCCTIIRNRVQVIGGLVVLWGVAWMAAWNSVFNFTFAVLMFVTFAGALLWASSSVQRQYQEAVSRINKR